MLNIAGGKRDLLIALVGRMVSTFGDGVALVALTLRLQEGGARPYEVALLLAAGIVPLLLVARLAGRLADSRDSRHLLVATGLIEIACTAPLIVVHSVVLMVALVTVLAATASVSGSTWSALIPRIVGEDQVARAVSARQSLNALAMVGAPAVGGLLAGSFGTGVPLMVDTATFVVLTLAAIAVRTRRRPEGVGASAGVRPRGGFEILRTDPVLGPLTIGLGLVVLLVGMVDVVLVFLVRTTLHAGAMWYGVAEASWMAGLVFGSLYAGRLRTERARILATLAGAIVVCAALALFAVAPAVWMLVPLSIVGGVGNGCTSVCFSTLLVSRTQDAERGRVSAAANAVLGGAEGLSLLAGGAAAAVLSPREIYGLAGVLGLVFALVIAVFTASRPRVVAASAQVDSAGRDGAEVTGGRDQRRSVVAR